MVVSKTVKTICLGMIWCLAWAAPAAAAPATSKAAHPDMFLITIDTLRADHVHCYGYAAIRTPALDGLAHEGVRFTQAFTPSPITNTSHTSILTGLLPSSHGVTDFAIPLAASHATLAETLKREGYHTAAFIGAVILDSKTLAPGLDRGFDFYDNFPAHPATQARWGRVERRGMEVVQRAEAWLTAHPAGPRFVWVHLYDPHDPYEPPAPYSVDYKNNLYDGEIAYADSALAHFLAYLKGHSAYSNAAIVVTGDHGEGLGQHREETHGIFLYDSTTHVPLILKLPGGTGAGKVVEAQVRTLDIFPTLVDFANAAMPEKLDGQSLSPLLAGQETAARAALGETDYPLRFGWAPLRSVRSDGFKFIQAPRPELYDLRADPSELKNQYQPGEAGVKKFLGMLNGTRAKESSASALPDPASPDPALPDPKDKIEEQNLLHTAMLASDDGRNADARAALEKVLQLNPTSGTALRQLGELELHAGEYPRAAQHLGAAFKARPDDATAAFLEGQALNEARDFAGARDALEATLKLQPGQLPARVLLGQVYLALNDPKAADDQLEAALLIDPNNVEARIGTAKVQIAGASFDEAVRQLEPLAKSEPRNAKVFELLAQAYSALGKKAEAQQAQARAALLRRQK
jgi:choline-sulfatase